MPEPGLYTKPDLICFSHLRWNFVFQRPQHLLTRCAGERRVFYVEEPLLVDGQPRLTIQDTGGVQVVVPHVAGRGTRIGAASTGRPAAL